MPGFEFIDEEERLAVDKIFTDGNGVLFAHGFDTRRDSFRVRNFEKKLCDKFSVKYALACTSGSAALFLGLKALGVGPGDEVVTQAYTFVATVEAILMCGATPIMTEVDATYNMDPEDLKKKISEKTKVIIPVHMAGVSARMKEIIEIARANGLVVLEDTAQGIGAKNAGRYLGTIGDIGAFSLDFGKTVTCGEGGFLLTDNEKIYSSALAFHDHGHEYNKKFGRAEDTRRIWGFNFRMNEMSAAVASVQLDKLEKIISESKRVKMKIVNSIKCCANITFREHPENSEENYDSIVFSFSSARETQQVLSKLREKNISTKNIPDALRWHFSGMWEHIFSDTDRRSWLITKELLSRSIALPVMAKWGSQEIAVLLEKLIPAIQSSLAQ
jgi:8-amino-3,8-dideoxy-alpha-D-manno-octulosonate transaminase